MVWSDVSNVVIALATVANFVVYFLLFKQTKKSVDEMRRSTDFFIVSQMVSGLPEQQKRLRKLFPDVATKFQLDQ